MLDDGLLVLLEPKLDGPRDTELRSLTVRADSRFAGAAPLLEKRASRLDPADRERSRALLRAIGRCKARRAHDAVVDYYEKSDDEHAVRALGRLWEMRLNAPALDRADEIRRLSTEEDFLEGWERLPEESVCRVGWHQHQPLGRVVERLKI